MNPSLSYSATILTPMPIATLHPPSILPSDHKLSDDLCVAYQASNGSIVRVGIGAIESQCGVPRVGSTLIARPQSRDLSLSSGSGVLCGLISTADVGQLIVDTVGDDVWVESLLLSLVDERVNGLEGECG